MYVPLIFSFLFFWGCFNLLFSLNFYKSHKSLMVIRRNLVVGLMQIHKFSEIRSLNPPTRRIRLVQPMTRTAGFDPYIGSFAGQTFGNSIQSGRVRVGPNPS